MLLKDAIKKIENSKVFKDYKKENPKYYLAHAFTMINAKQTDWQVGYYNKKKDRVVVFEAGKEITKNPEEELFKKDKTAVKELDLKKIKIDLKKALSITEKLRKEKYSAELATKKIVILQNLETELYNLTLVTQSFNIINVKIDANNGKILHESRQSILGLKKG